MKKKHKRLLLASGVFCFLSCIIFFTLATLRDNISFFYTVSEAPSTEKSIRIGGVVIEGSVVHNESKVIFQVTDFYKSVKVIYKGILPPMFSEKRGVVVQGRMIDDNTFLADTVFAKHDENYMPPKR